MHFVKKIFLPALTALAISIPVVAAEQAVTTAPQAFDGPSSDGEVPVLSGKSGGKGGRSEEDAEKNRRILNELCRQRGASSTLDRLGPILWDGEDAKNKGNCI